MDLQHLTTFRTIAFVGSFSQAAGLMGYAQSTVSEHIRLLEIELGASLFKRSGSKRIALTAAGERLLGYAEKMSNLEDEIRSEVNQPSDSHGSLSIRIPETVSIHFLPPLLPRFHRIYPGVNLGFMNCTFFDLEEELKTGNADLGFLIIDQFQSPGLLAEILRPVPLVMVTYPSNPLLGQPNVDFAALKGEPFVAPANDCSYVQMLERIMLEQKVRLTQVWRFNSLAAILQALASGIGFTILPEIAVRAEVESGRLAILPWRDQGRVTVNLLMIWRENKYFPPALQAFMDMARAELMA